MARYIRPSMVEDHARLLDSQVQLVLAGAGAHSMALRQLRLDEQLILALDNGVRKIYPVIRDEQIYKGFYEQYAVYGDFLSMQFMAVKQSELERLINTG